jgi:hypothetical protein
LRIEAKGGQEDIALFTTAVVHGAIATVACPMSETVAVCDRAFAILIRSPGSLFPALSDLRLFPGVMVHFTPVFISFARS